MPRTNAKKIGYDLGQHELLFLLGNKTHIVLFTNIINAMITFLNTYINLIFSAYLIVRWEHHIATTITIYINQKYYFDIFSIVVWHYLCHDFFPTSIPNIAYICLTMICVPLVKPTWTPPNKLRKKKKLLLSRAKRNHIIKRSFTFQQPTL